MRFSLAAAMAAFCVLACWSWGRASAGPPEDVPAAFLVRVDVAAQDRPIGEVTGVLQRRHNVVISYDAEVPGELKVSAVSKGDTLWTFLNRLAVAAKLKVVLTGPRSARLKPLSSVHVRDRDGYVGGVEERYRTCRGCREDLQPRWRYCPMCGERIRR